MTIQIRPHRQKMSPEERRRVRKIVLTLVALFGISFLILVVYPAYRRYQIQKQFASIKSLYEKSSAESTSDACERIIGNGLTPFVDDPLAPVLHIVCHNGTSAARLHADHMPVRFLFSYQPESLQDRHWC